MADTGSDHQEREDVAPTLDAISRVRNISEEIHRIQGEIHAATDTDERTRLESALAAQQIALENLLSIESSGGFDPEATVTELNRKLKEGGLSSAPTGVGRLLEGPGT